jgi:cell pole-organizing protein PopZ
VELKVDDLLSNVRKSVESDLDNISNGTTAQTRGTLMRGALREMRVSMNADQAAPLPAAKVREEISDLRSRIKERMAAMEADPFVASAHVAPPPPSRSVVPARSDFSGIMSGPPRSAGLRQSFAFEDPQDDLRYMPQQQAGWPEQPAFEQQDPYADSYGYAEQGYAPHYPPALESPIVSPHTEAHAETAFRQLSDAILSRATGDKSLEDMTRDMLRTMLKQWLDANLPGIVEDMVRDEIQRVARRGR